LSCWQSLLLTIWKIYKPMSSIIKDPLLTDIFEMISEKLEDVPTIRELLGEGNNLRIYRAHPPKHTLYPVISMQLITRSNMPLDYLYRDYIIRLTVRETSSNRGNQDLIMQTILDVFSNPETNYSTNTTKIEAVTVNSGPGEGFETENRIYTMFETLTIKARRKTNII